MNKTVDSADCLFQRASQSHSPLDISEHKRLRFSVTNSLATAKSKYLETRITNAKSSKERWRELRSMGTTKPKNSSSFKHFSPDSLNTHFASILNRHLSLSPLDISEILPVKPSPQLTQLFTFHEIGPMNKYCARILPIVI